MSKRPFKLFKYNRKKHFNLQDCIATLYVYSKPAIESLPINTCSLLVDWSKVNGPIME